uniref:(northern house mosquito) hypothetical protein n=1 Tax=Culex pipiens TaxID=7175 RepID=A0A8D8DI80_CULPI
MKTNDNMSILAQHSITLIQTHMAVVCFCSEIKSKSFRRNFSVKKWLLVNFSSVNSSVQILFCFVGFKFVVFEMKDSAIFQKVLNKRLSLSAIPLLCFFFILKANKILCFVFFFHPQI